jgi:hypothetical protein
LKIGLRSAGAAIQVYEASEGVSAVPGQDNRHIPLPLSSSLRSLNFSMSGRRYCRAFHGKAPVGVIRSGFLQFFAQRKRSLPPDLCEYPQHAIIYVF